ncbi:hypothetical protein [Cohnella rhizosphaerae]|uniref:Uncharacterized protein n=1 Tax=Cohnella rhizosphaerae TaxID=1457232 RepID=A0A9X4QW92_9BACL|nr:hypothetical protein [Cohnella rhizosphaerae]MDG0812172.1 hypothetical protein [Cohnella rhizosphaerae]
MRRRYAFIGLLFTVAVAVFAVPLVVPQPAVRDRSASPSALPPENHYAAAAKVERALKLGTVERDMETTGMLCRIECSSDMRKLAAAASGSGSGPLSDARKKSADERPDVRQPAL